ncbi:hypothetical protein ACUNEJ_25055, partial [Serratia sp. IR-2025]
LADIWIRIGWGHWTFIDPDKLLPHNLPRHIGVDDHIGMYGISSAHLPVQLQVQSVTYFLKQDC